MGGNKLPLMTYASIRRDCKPSNRLSSILRLPRILGCWMTLEPILTPLPLITFIKWEKIPDNTISYFITFVILTPSGLSNKDNFDLNFFWIIMSLVMKTKLENE